MVADGAQGAHRIVALGCWVPKGVANCGGAATAAPGPVISRRHGDLKAAVVTRLVRHVGSAMGWVYFNEIQCAFLI